MNVGKKGPGWQKKGGSVSCEAVNLSRGKKRSGNVKG